MASTSILLLGSKTNISSFVGKLLPCRRLSIVDVNLSECPSTTEQYFKYNVTPGRETISLESGVLNISKLNLVTVMIIDDSLDRNKWLDFIYQNDLHRNAIGVIMSKNNDNTAEKDLLLLDELDPLGFGYDKLSYNRSSLDLEIIGDPLRFNRRFATILRTCAMPEE